MSSWSVIETPPKNIEKISFILPSLNAGGAERVCLNLAKGLLEQGIKVDFLLVMSSVQLDIPEGARVRFLTKNSRKRQWVSGIVALFKLQRYFSGARTDEVFIASVRGTVILSLLASLFTRSIPRLFIREAALYSSKIWYPELCHRLSLKFLYPKAKAVIAVSEGVRKEMIERFSYKGKISVVNNPIDTKKITELSLSSLKRSKFKFTYLSVGRLVEEKGFSYLLEAFSEVSSDATIGLYIVGAGELENKLRLRASELQISDQVVWLGYQSNPYPWYLLADVFVLSSIKEGFVNVLAEALALGVPNIVATKCGGGPEELLENHSSSWLVPPANAGALAEAMKKAKVCGKQRPVDEYCSGLTISEVTKMYLEVIDQNS